MIPPLLYSTAGQSDQWIVASGVRARVPARAVPLDIADGRAILELYHRSTGDLPDFPADFLCVSGSRVRRLLSLRSGIAKVVPGGYALMIQPPDASIREVRFFTETLRRRPDSPGLPEDWALDPEGLVRGPGGVWVVEDRRGRAFWCRPGRRAEAVRRPGLIALAPGARRGVWWSGGRTVYALTAGRGADLRPGRVLWSRPDPKIPAVRLITGGLVVERPIFGPTDATLVSVLTTAGRELRGDVPPDPQVIGPDGTFWRGEIPFSGPSRVFLMRWSSSRVSGRRGRWTRVPDALPPNTTGASFKEQTSPR